MILSRLQQRFLAKMKANTDKDISRFTVSRRLNEFGLTAYSPATKPLISKKNRKAWLEYAEVHFVLRDEDRDWVYFSNESKFNLLWSDGRQFVRRVAGNRSNPKCVKKFAKFGRRSVIVWRILSSEGVGPLVRIIGTVNANENLNLVEQHVTPSFEASLNQSAIFMHDNAPAILQSVLRIILNKRMYKAGSRSNWKTLAKNNLQMWRIYGTELNKNGRK